MIKANFHTHTELCKHASGTPVDYAEEAVKKGLEILGMSDHGPFRDTDYGYRMLYDQLDLYCSQVQEAKDKYKNQLKIYTGLEIEYLSFYAKTQDYYNWLLESGKVEYLILGEHMFQDSQGNVHNSFYMESPELAVDYAKNCAEGMKTGCFKILAHPDVICINEPIGWNDWYERAADIIIDAAVQNSVILEYNANGIRRGKKEYQDGMRYPYPHEKFWQKVKESGARAIVGSDAHEVSFLWDSNVETACRNLDDLGIPQACPVI